MFISSLDLYRIGIGPSSSHTVGPMRAAAQFTQKLAAEGLAPLVTTIRCDCYGSLAATGKGHGTDKALIFGLMGEDPELIDLSSMMERESAIRTSQLLRLPWGKEITFRPASDLTFKRLKPLPLHPNGMHFFALDAAGDVLTDEVFYSLGGGFIATEQEMKSSSPPTSSPPTSLVPYPFSSAVELMALTRDNKLRIADIMRTNENAIRPESETISRLDAIWQAMQHCVNRGIAAQGELPGGLRVRRRANNMYQQLISKPESCLADPLSILDWVNLYALAVNEENAAGGRVVTAPTNGAAGIIPAVLHYAVRFRHSNRASSIHDFLLTAAAIGSLYKKNASISGAEAGCQGEVGVACSMAAGGLVEFLGGTPQQVENAAEIGMEHNLGLTCDPIGGLVQIPCIERNAMGSVKAINAARLAMSSDGQHYVSLDKVIKTMRDTGRDMHSKYKETSRGGLAVNVVEC